MTTNELTALKERSKVFWAYAAAYDTCDFVEKQFFPYSGMRWWLGLDDRGRGKLARVMAYLNRRVQQECKVLERMVVS